MGPSGETADEMEEMGIDPEFLAALPPELQAEVLQQQRSERGLAVRGVQGAWGGWGGCNGPEHKQQIQGSRCRVYQA